jgi:glycosyltransferase involved in cell wall biosynthesis
MNILMVLPDIDFPPDIRVEKEARALLSAGHKLSILCSSIKSRPNIETWNGIKIHRLAPLEGLFRKREGLWRSITLGSHRWEREIQEVIKKEEIDIVHLHDLPLASSVRSASKKAGLYMVLDLHENYPAALRYYTGATSIAEKIKHKLFLYPARLENYELKSSEAADQIFVVVDEAKERLVETGVQRDKITVIENTEDIDYFTQIPIDIEYLQEFQNDFVISYIGGFGGEHRGLDIAIYAMPVIVEKIPNARLLLVGRGSIQSKLEKIASDLSIKDKVTIMGWQPFEKVPTLISLSQVCLVPHQSNPHTEATSPHKLFQYMLMGKPVIVSSCRPLQRIIQETGGGLVFEAGNCNSLAQSVIQLSDDDLRHRLGEAGRKAVLDKYNWQLTSRKLLEAYDTFC